MRNAEERQRMRRRKVILIRILLVAAVLLLPSAIFLRNRNRLHTAPSGTSEGKRPVNSQVEAYRSDVREIAEAYGIGEYEDLILAVIMQESSGMGTDVMASSESGFNTRYDSTPGSIEDPRYSIECGVQTLKIAMERACVQSPRDMDRIALALQGYNFGINGYLDYVWKNEIRSWSRETAEEYAKMASGEVLRGEDNPFAETAGPWDYGDQRYPEHVLRYYDVSASS